MKNTPLVTPVREAHRIDETRLAEYLDGRLEGFTGPLVVRQFEGGQSTRPICWNQNNGSGYCAANHQERCSLPPIRWIGNTVS